MHILQERCRTCASTRRRRGSRSSSSAVRLRVHGPRRRLRLRLRARKGRCGARRSAHHVRARGTHRRDGHRAVATRSRHGGRPARSDRARKVRRAARPASPPSARNASRKHGGTGSHAAAPHPRRGRRRPYAVPARHHGAAFARARLRGRRRSRRRVRGDQRRRRAPADVVLLDLHMPGISGIDAMQAILRDAPGTHIVMLTVSEQADDLMLALRQGAWATSSRTSRANSSSSQSVARRRRIGHVAGDDFQAAARSAQRRAGRRAAGIEPRERRSSSIWPEAQATRKSPATSRSPRARSRSTCSTSCASSSSRAASRPPCGGRARHRREGLTPFVGRVKRRAAASRPAAAGQDRASARRTARMSGTGSGIRCLESRDASGVTRRIFTIR